MPSTKPPTPVVKLDLPNGRWLRMHLATVNQQLEVSDLPAIPPGDDESFKARYREWLSLLDEACEETSWHGRVGDGLALSEVQPTLERWLVLTEDDAFPLASESDSGTSSAEPLSEAPTADPSPSTGRRSRKSSR